MNTPSNTNFFTSLSRLRGRVGLWASLPSLRKAAAMAALLLPLFLHAQPPVVHPSIGQSMTTTDGKVTVTLVGKKQNYAIGGTTYDADINSPKSVHIHPNGQKYYVNSLEGCVTVAYDFASGEKIKSIHHNFHEQRDAALWSEPSGLFPWKHYDKNLNTFSGKPVESTFSHGGRYLWVSYYRRSFDINAQDPSAVAVIDTETDSIIRLMETGPLPKMITTSPDGTIVAISHWGNNTVGLIDISSANPREWQYICKLIVDYELPLDFPLDCSVDRDNGSGYALRGTVFTPDNRYLLVGCMGGGGGIAVIDIPARRYLGRVLGMQPNVRHLALADGYLYLSINAGGMVQRIPLDTFLRAAQNMQRRTTTLRGWQTARVGAGARTISLTPNGQYIFAACNNESALYVVEAETMTTIGHIDADSYPVGLDISSDGRYVFTTSQGRQDKGGNCVDIYEVTYKDYKPQAEVQQTAAGKPAETEAGSKQAEEGQSAEIPVPHPRPPHKPKYFTTPGEWIALSVFLFSTSALIAIRVAGRQKAKISH